MTKKEKAQFVAQQLEIYYPKVDIPLNFTNGYTLLIAVLLSAQCTDKRVNEVSPRLFALADNPEAMSRLPVEQIKEIIRPCGLANNKSKAIAQLSEILCQQHNGNIPNTMAELEALPGVGHKTASVVMSQFFGEPAFPVDTHIHRLAYRWTLSTGKNVVKTEQDLKRLFAKEKWNKLHIQIILFGRNYCPARGHNPYDCPICSVIGRKRMFTDYDAAMRKKERKK